MKNMMFGIGLLIFSINCYILYWITDRIMANAWIYHLGLVSNLAGIIILVLSYVDIKKIMK